MLTIVIHGGQRIHDLRWSPHINCGSCWDSDDVCRTTSHYTAARNRGRRGQRSDGGRSTSQNDLHTSPAVSTKQLSHPNRMITEASSNKMLTPFWLCHNKHYDHTKIPRILSSQVLKIEDT